MDLASIPHLPPPVAYDVDCDACGAMGKWGRSLYCPACEALPDATRKRVRTDRLAAAEVARLAKRRAEKLAEVGLPVRFQRVQPATTPLDPEEWRVLHGGTGTGKTHRAAELTLRFVEDRKGTAAFVSWPALLDDRRSSFGGNGEDPLPRLKTVDLLVLDDVGAEKVSEWTQEVAFVLLDARYAWCRSTVLTTNLAPELLAGYLGERAMSRLLQVAKFEAKTGEDRRLA